MRPIRVHLLLLVLGAMLPGAMLTGVLVWRAFAENRAIGERRLLESARVDASALDREFESTINTLRVLATSPSLDHGDFEAFHQEGRRVQTTEPGWFTILLLSTEGKQLVSTRVQWGEALIPVVEPESLQQVVATRKPVVGVIRPSPRGGPEHLFAVRVPVLRHDELLYVVSAIVDVESIAHIVPPLTNSEEWNRSILDPQGTIAVRTRGADGFIGATATEAFRSRLAQAPESISSETTREGNPVYAATSRGAYGWTAVVVVPRSTLDAPLGASVTAVVIGGLLLMLCGLAAVLVISHRLAADLAAATDAAEAVAEGRSVPHADAHVAETQRLQRSLVTAASLLKRRARERDDEVQRADAARTEAEQANRTKDQFLAVLGHELRNPLAPALTALELMKLRDPEVFKREREVLERQVAHMARLVNDLLDVSRLNSGKLQLERRRFEIREAIDRALDMVRPLITQKQHTLNVFVPNTGLLIDADIHRIVQILSNLLSNAAKYTPPGGHVIVTAKASGDRVMVMCEDDGPGVAAELVPKLFDPFAQGPRALDRLEGGLGLGLSLARSLTELHGGTIHVEGRDGKAGSRFVVSLPLAEVAASEESESASPPAERADTKKVIVVDDNMDACEMLRSALEHAGHVVAIAGSGQDAIAIAADFGPDVGVLDLGLPGMSGYELAGHLRTSHPGIRLIALSGYGQAGDVEAAVIAGFDAHFAKPVTTSVLLANIEARIESSLHG